MMQANTYLTLSRLRPWLIGFSFIALLLLSHYAPTQAVAPKQSTIPSVPGLLTEIRGPITAIDSSTLWFVAGIPVTRDSATRYSDRYAPAEVGRWVRVQGRGDGRGGLLATRVQTSAPQDFVRVRGPLIELTGATVVVDHITLLRTPTTKVAGAPQATRVEVKAALQVDNQLAALSVVKQAGPSDDDEDPLPGPVVEVKLTGSLRSELVVDTLPQDLVISGIPVHLSAATIIDSVPYKAGPKPPKPPKEPEDGEQEGDGPEEDELPPDIEEIWVKVTGQVNDAGILVASKLVYIPPQDQHQLDGVLTGLTETQVTVSTLVLARAADAVVRGLLEPGEPVKVEALLQEDQTLLAIKIEGRQGNQPPHKPRKPHTLVELIGEVETRPQGEPGGVWTIAGQSITVDPVATEIKEQKGAAALGARVRVTAYVEENGSLSALSIVVIR
jgi:hypothetical protein